jgi:hypothetical protein
MSWGDGVRGVKRSVQVLLGKLLSNYSRESTTPRGAGAGGHVDGAGASDEPVRPLLATRRLGSACAHAQNFGRSLSVCSVCGGDGAPQAKLPDEVLVHDAAVRLEGEAMLNLSSSALRASGAAVPALRPPPPPPVAPFGEEAFQGVAPETRYNQTPPAPGSSAALPPAIDDDEPAPRNVLASLPPRHGITDAHFTVEVESARAWIGAPQFLHPSTLAHARAEAQRRRASRARCRHAAGGVVQAHVHAGLVRAGCAACALFGLPSCLRVLRTCAVCSSLPALRARMTFSTPCQATALQVSRGCGVRTRTMTKSFCRYAAAFSQSNQLSEI